MIFPKKGADPFEWYQLECDEALPERFDSDDRLRCPAGIEPRQCIGAGVRDSGLGPDRGGRNADRGRVPQRTGVGIHCPGCPVSPLRLLAPSQSPDARLGAGAGFGRGGGASWLAGCEECPADQAVRRHVDPPSGAGSPGAAGGHPADPVTPERVPAGADRGGHRPGGLRRLGADRPEAGPEIHPRRSSHHRCGSIRKTGASAPVFYVSTIHCVFRSFVSIDGIDIIFFFVWYVWCRTCRTTDTIFRFHIF